MTLQVPVIRIFEFDTSEVADPVGTRNIAGGSFAFKQRVALGCTTASPLDPLTSGTLKFENVKFNVADPASHAVSKTTAIVLSLGNSGVGISNIRLFLADDTAFQAQRDVGLDPGFVQIASSGTWITNPVFPSGAGTRLTTTVPALPNIRRQDGFSALLTQDDANVSEYVYMNLIIPYNTFFRSYGVCGSGLLRMGIVFDFFEVGL